jgi:hypothetical protein
VRYGGSFGRGRKERAGTGKHVFGRVYGNVISVGMV